MGQAKRRGAFEERKQEAQDRVNRQIQQASDNWNRLTEAEKESYMIKAKKLNKKNVGVLFLAMVMCAKYYGKI